MKEFKNFLRMATLKDVFDIEPDAEAIIKARLAFRRKIASEAVLDATYRAFVEKTALEAVISDEAMRNTVSELAKKGLLKAKKKYALIVKSIFYDN